MKFSADRLALEAHGSSPFTVPCRAAFERFSASRANIDMALEFAIIKVS
jgi:hypothetical protein